MPYTPSADAVASLALLVSELADLGIGPMTSDGKVIEAMFDAFKPYIATTGHSLGPAVSWTQGSTAGKIEFPACPNASAFSATGCDEGGTVTWTAGTGTTTGEIIKIHFAVAFPASPAVQFYPANDAAAHLNFVAELHSTRTTTTASLNTASGISPMSNVTYSFSWLVKGST
jgi:hypothetical protein